MKTKRIILLLSVTVLSISLLWAVHVYFQIDPDKCTSCGICYPVCDYGAIQFDYTTFTYSIDPELCTACGECYNTCNNGAISYVVGNTDEDVPSVTKLSVYPNPVKTELTIDLGESKKQQAQFNISIFNLKGQKINDFILTDKLFKWDLKNKKNELVEDGIYFVKIDSKEESKFVKIIVVK